MNLNLNLFYFTEIFTYLDSAEQANVKLLHLLVLVLALSQSVHLMLETLDVLHTGL